MNGLVGQLIAGDEVFGLLHDGSHLLQFVESDAGETAGSHNQAGGFYSDARHTQDGFIIGGLYIDGEELRMAKGPGQFRVNLQVQIRTLVVHYLVYLELIEA